MQTLDGLKTSLNNMKEMLMKKPDHIIIPKEYSKLEIYLNKCIKKNKLQRKKYSPSKVKIRKFQGFEAILDACSSGHNVVKSFHSI